MTQTTAQMGQDAETRFEKIARATGLLVSRSHRDADMFGHYDFIVGNKKVEVKGMKRASRHGKIAYDWIYVEFKNVNGDRGWLYGEADLIAFEQPEGFLLVPRQELADLAEEKILYLWTNKPTPYASYRRGDRPLEHVGVLLLTDLASLPRQFLRG